MLRTRGAAFGVVLATGMAAATASQFLFGVLGPLLVREFDISRSRLGLLTTVAFLVGGLTSPAAGRLTDRAGGRNVFVGSMMVMLAAMLGMAASTSFPLLVVAAAPAGAALAACNPTTNKLIAAHLPPGRRGVVTGVKQAGVQAGAFVIGFGLPPIATALSWRAAMAAAIVLPAGAIAGALLFVPPDTPLGRAPRRGSKSPLGPTVTWMRAYAVLMGAGVAVIGTYLPLYAAEVAGLGVRSAGALAGTIGVVGVVSRIAWGWGTERSGAFALPLVVMALGAAAATALVLLAAPVGGALLWPAALLFGTTAVTWNVVGMLAIVSQFDAGDTGRASGAVVGGFYFGFVLSPVLFGGAVDRTGSYAPAWGAVVGIFLVAALVAYRWHAAARRS